MLIAPASAEATAESPSASAPLTAPTSEPDSAHVAIAPEDGARIDAAVRGAIEREEIPGAVVLVVAGDKVVFHRAYGLRSKEPEARPMRLGTVFDLASLTKPIATATSIVWLAERGALRLGDAASRYLPELNGGAERAITIEDLLLHTSGFPADNPLADYTGDRAEMIRRALLTPRKNAPGYVYTYSDVGYIALGEIVRRASSKPLDAFAREALFEPLSLVRTTFTPSPALAGEAAPTERIGDLILSGKVHDPRARALSGVAGHAGLFSTAADLGRFARMLLSGGALEGQRALSEKAVRTLLVPREIPGGKRAYFGAVSGTAVSHTGFTGTSFWIDPARRIAIIVLSNRVHPDGKGSADRLRREVHEAAAQAATAALRDKSKSQVMTGIDVLEETDFSELSGRKVALLTHAAGRTRKGRSTALALSRVKRVKLVALLSPEHGLSSTEEGAISTTQDAATGLTIHSLYGSSKRPTKDMLAGADTLVIDLQDAGARFYTYETTLGYALEAAAQCGIRVVVLDRPNPTGGARVEGPVLDAGKESFVGYHNVPIRHGMTLGELARLFVAERKIRVDLKVVEMRGWTRDALFEDTHLLWTSPSPNLKSPKAALLYPGIGLLETTNLSVGRGTSKPFEYVGAPFIDSAKLAAAVRDAKPKGVIISEAHFTPDTSVFKGQLCHGIGITVTDPKDVSSVLLGLSIATALVRLFPSDWQPQGLITLLGHERAQKAIVAGLPLDRVLATFEAETAAFIERRKPYLLY